MPLYDGPMVPVPDLGADPLDEHGMPRADNGGQAERICVHCGEPARPGEPVCDVWVGDEGRAFPLHRRCEDEWLKEG